MTVTNPLFRSTPPMLERTLRCRWSRPRMLPGAAFTDPAVLEWERANFFRGGWICAGHVEQVRERGQYLTRRGRRRERARRRRRRRPPARVPEHLPPPRRAAASSDAAGTLRRLQCPYHAWTYGFDGALKNAPFTDGPGGLRPRRASRCTRSASRSSRAWCCSTSPARRRRRRSTSATSRRSWPRYRLPELRRARADRLRRRRQLEGDRRELQRVPALPGRAPGAQPPLALPVGRDDRGRAACGAAAR